MFSPETFGSHLMLLDPQSATYLSDVDALVRQVPEPQHMEVIPHIFSFFEGYPENMEGVPGTLVHLIERFYPAYKKLLLDSLVRGPSYFGVVMVNRILNSKLSDIERTEYMQMLSRVVSDHICPAMVRKTADRFLERQRGIGT